ncbi:MAG: winged helix-turn-helix transcriptional regulator [Novosphingobium sp.]|nr:winged helix-turn-helix transcriptional regulator [Novosphingobium sp.]
MKPLIDREATLRRVESPLARKPHTPADVSDLDWDVIGFVCEGLAFARRALVHGTEPVTRKFALGPRGAWILNCIDNGLVYPFELATVFKAGRSLITVELARLTEAGLITSRPGEQDRRRTELALTAIGKEACDQIRKDTSEMIRTNLAGYTPEQVMLFARMLRDVRGGADAPKDHDAGCPPAR